MEKEYLEGDGDETTHTKYVGADAIDFYKVIFYESRIYGNYTDPHKCAIRAFGIDTTVMTSLPPPDSHESGERDIRILFVGKFADYKRPLDLLDMMVDGRIADAEAQILKSRGPHSATKDPHPARVVAVGDYEPVMHYPEGPGIADALRAGGVEVWEPVPYLKLAALYRRARLVVVPCTETGGGERAVLEVGALVLFLEHGSIPLCLLSLKRLFRVFGNFIGRLTMPCLISRRVLVEQRFW